MWSRRFFAAPFFVTLLGGLQLPAAAPKFDLVDTAGVSHSSADWARAHAVVLYFVATDCPIANSYVPEMNRIHDAYAPKGVEFFAVQSDVSAAPDAVAKYATDFGYAYPMLLDPEQQLVRFTGASVTPQVAILSPEGKLLYLGRVDNRVADFGKQRPRATVADLRNSLDAVLAGKPVPEARTRSVGCAINLKKQSPAK
jgi:thiol-disulfide isomerase/thioredoxin